jgi:hypothetical protein
LQSKDYPDIQIFLETFSMPFLQNLKLYLFPTFDNTGLQYYYMCSLFKDASYPSQISRNKYLKLVTKV